MTEYITTDKVQLFTGKIHLTDEQASVRMHALKKIGGDKYRIESPIEFMTGEKIGFVGEIPLGIAVSPVADVPDEKPPVEEAPKTVPAIKPRRRRK